MRKLISIIGIICCLGVATGATSAPAHAHSVYYNTKTHIYHKHSCSAATRCTRNCITTTDDAARARGGRPCHICGG